MEADTTTNETDRSGVPSNNNIEVLDNQALNAARESRQAKLAQFEARRVARSIVVPTDDKQVVSELRKRSKPACHYGEDAHDRRERLRQIMAAEVIKTSKDTNHSTQPETKIEKEQEQDLVVKEKEKEFFTKGSDCLLYTSPSPRDQRGSRMPSSA